MNITERLNEHFSEWESRYAFQTFMRDGVVCEEQYEHIVFILKDVNNAKPDDCNDLRDYVKKSTDGGKTWFNVARWTSALLDGKDYSQMIQYVDDTHSGNKHTFQHEQLCRVAIINLKKEAGGASVSDSVINRYAFEHKVELYKQIMICDPKLIVVCGLGIFEGAKSVLGKVKPWIKERPAFEMAAQWEMGTVCLNGKDVPIVQFRHPATGCSAEKSYNDMQKIRMFFYGKTE